jgi:hypothetical protein
MGRVKVNKPRRERPEFTLETREPSMSLPGWPESHVSTGLTGDEDDECVFVTIHGVKHRLHATTARALEESLRRTLVEYNQKCAEAHVPGV